MTQSPDVPTPVRQLAAELAAPRPMRRGSVSIRTVKCHKPGCRCAVRPEARHGPYVSLVRVVGGRTQSRWVAPDQVDVLRRQVEAGQFFRKQVEKFWEACEKWADTELDAPEAASHEAAEKGGSKRRSRRRSSKRSKRS